MAVKEIVNAQVGAELLTTRSTGCAPHKLYTILLATTSETLRMRPARIELGTTGLDCDKGSYHAASSDTDQTRRPSSSDAIAAYSVSTIAS